MYLLLFFFYLQEYKDVLVDLSKPRRPMHIMMSMPATTHRPKKTAFWNTVLMQNYRRHITGPFYADPDEFSCVYCPEERLFP